MSSEMEKIKKKLEEIEETVKKHTSARLDHLETRLKDLEEKVKKKM